MLFTLAKFITATAAAEYAATSEKYLFATEILDMADLPRNDLLVDYVETQLENLGAAA